MDAAKRVERASGALDQARGVRHNRGGLRLSELRRWRGRDESNKVRLIETFTNRVPVELKGFSAIKAETDRRSCGPPQRVRPRLGRREPTTAEGSGCSGTWGIGRSRIAAQASGGLASTAGQSATCHKLDLVLSEISEVSRPAHERGDIAKAGRAEVVEELPSKMVETEAALWA